MNNKQEYKIVRSSKAGVFFGFIEEEKDNTVIMTDVIRIWYWDGAASLSQLAMQGTIKPAECKFATPMKKVKIFDVIEIIDCEECAVESIKNVKPWVV